MNRKREDSARIPSRADGSRSGFISAITAVIAPAAATTSRMDWDLLRTMSFLSIHAHVEARRRQERNKRRDAPGRCNHASGIGFNRLVHQDAQSGDHVPVYCDRITPTSAGSPVSRRDGAPVLSDYAGVEERCGGVLLCWGLQ